MSRIKGQNTKPEIRVRSMLHQLGFRFRLHRSDLPGKPDITLPKYRTVIFVHGCFWHKHPGCRLAYTPRSNEAFWSEKLASNVKRDKRNQRALRKLGWSVRIIWECQTKDWNRLQKLILAKLSL
jgi:DNA mismatch endonuclease (patch repair protein)